MLAYKKDFVSNKILQPGGENKENKKFYLWAFRFYQTSDIKTWKWSWLSFFPISNYLTSLKVEGYDFTKNAIRAQ